MQIRPDGSEGTNRTEYSEGRGLQQCCRASTFERIICCIPWLATHKAWGLAQSVLLLLRAFRFLHYGACMVGHHFACCIVSPVDFAWGRFVLPYFPSQQLVYTCERPQGKIWI